VNDWLITGAHKIYPKLYNVIPKNIHTSPHRGLKLISPPTPFGCPNTLTINWKQIFLPSPSRRQKIILDLYDHFFSVLSINRPTLNCTFWCDWINCMYWCSHGWVETWLFHTQTAKFLLCAGNTKFCQKFCTACYKIFARRAGMVHISWQTGKAII
jgi:hypothetical protein